MSGKAIDEVSATATGHTRHELKRSLGLLSAVLYGLGVTIGAGIYVLVGAASARAGFHAPLAFVLAAIVMAPSAAAIAELATRFPVSAGEAAYVEEGLRSKRLATSIGMLVFVIAIIMAAAISLGSAGYLSQFFDVPLPLIAAIVILVMGMISAWGIVESIAVAGIMTLIEVGGLLVIIVLGGATLPDVMERLPEMWPGASAAHWAGVMGAALLAFFAFTGFEGLSNIAEEVNEPRRTLPLAILLTLLLTTLLYIAVAWVALVAVGPAELGRSQAPLTLVFQKVSGLPPGAFNVVAIIATINGIIVNIVLAARVIYGLARRGHLPAILGEVNGMTRTPLLSTAMVTIATLFLALAMPIQELAEMSSRLTLIVFAFVNASLLALKHRGVAPPPGSVVVPKWVPAAGLVASIGLIIATLFS